MGLGSETYSLLCPPGFLGGCGQQHLAHGTRFVGGLARSCGVVGAREYALHLDKWATGLDHPNIEVVAVALGANDLLAGYGADTLRHNYAAFRARMTAAGKYTYALPVVPFELGTSTYIRPDALDVARLNYNQWPQDAGGARSDAKSFPQPNGATLLQTACIPMKKDVRCSQNSTRPTAIWIEPFNLEV